MPKTILTDEQEQEIIELYKTTISSTHKLAEIFKVGHKKISLVLTKYNIPINTKGGQIKQGNSKQIEQLKTHKYKPQNTNVILIAKCKKTNIEFEDSNNLSGVLTRHILDTYGDISYPQNTYQRKKYELTFGKKWFEEYFDILEIPKPKTRCCKLCDWETIDISNKTGCFEQHLINSHNINLSEYLNNFPEDTKFHSKYILTKNKHQKENHITCEICGLKLSFLNSKHLKKHNIALSEYKLRFPNHEIISNTYKNKLKETYSKTLKLHERTFVTNPQTELANFIESHNVNVKLNDKKTLSGIEIDIIMNDIKIGIEYNGLFYHTEKMGKYRQYHLQKTISMNRIGYKLIHIFEDEWLNNKELIKNKILHLIGVNNSTTIGARKCEIKEIDSNTKNLFLDKNHIQGKDKSIIYFGAYYNNILVAVMCFDNKRNMSLNKGNKNINHYELTRFCTDITYKIPGIADKLLKSFIKKYNPEKIISFGDVRWVLDRNNNLYTKLGFKLTKVIGPDYKYFNSKIARYKRLHKFGFGKTNLKKKYPNLDFSKSEKELTEELGFSRIWDCGLFKYELDIIK